MNTNQDDSLFLPSLNKTFRLDTEGETTEVYLNDENITNVDFSVVLKGISDEDIQAVYDAYKYDLFDLSSGND